MAKSEQYVAGQQAYYDGKTLVDNPYFPHGRRDHDSLRGDAWDDGWWDAYGAERKRKAADGE